jgi:RHS repeat-associated protein
LHRDRLGSAETLTDHNGQVTERRRFDPFGKPRGISSESLLTARLSSFGTDVDISKRGFTDHEHLDEQELIHMNGRVYDYNLGRFMSVDPLIQGFGNSQGLNPYSYVMNNPLAFVDPTGYATEVKEEKIKVRNKAVTGSRIRKKVTVGTKTTTTETDDNTGDVTSTSTLREYKNGSYAGNTVSYDNGKVDSVNVFSGNKDGTSSSVSMDFNSQGEIAKVSTIKKTKNGSGDFNTRVDQDPILMLGFTEATAYPIHRNYHAFALVADPIENKVSIIRGGPTSSVSSGLGAIMSFTGPFSKGSPFDQPINTLDYQIVGSLKDSFKNIQWRMKGYETHIRLRKIPYAVWGPNSNSLAFSFVESLGFDRPKPIVGEHRVMGWRDQL